MLLEEILIKSGAALTVAFVISVILQQALQVVFDWRIYNERLGGKGLKVPIAFVVALLVCYFSELDIISFVLDKQVPVFGYVITALAVSGGAKLWGRVFGDIQKGVSGVAGAKIKRK